MTGKKMDQAKGDPPKKRKQALGRGLDALLPGLTVGEADSQDFFQCDVAQIRPNRFQPRKNFPAAELQELARSIGEQGVIQPLLVRPEQDGYELIAGERRLRAAKLAGLEQVPVIVKSIGDAQQLELSIIENIQREDLNPIEEALAYKRLIEEFDLTQEQAAERVGKSRATVTNLLRLLQLPDEIRTSIKDGTISMGHARALLGAATAAQQRAAWRTVISKHLSVRDTERLINRLKSERKPTSAATAGEQEPYFRDLCDRLSRQFGTRVRINRRGRKGRVEIDFYSNDDLDRLLDMFGKF